MAKDGRVTDYVYRVNQEMRRFAQELLTENERLRRAMPQGSRPAGRSLEEVAPLRNELVRQSEEQSRLQAMVADVERENEHYSAQYQELEQQNFNLMNLYVAGYRLHGTLDPAEVHETIREIVANLIGSEEMAVFRLTPGSSNLELASSMGIDKATYGRVPLDSGIIGWVARTGRTFITADQEASSPSSPEPGLSACFPLRIEDRVTGAIAIFRLLQQKSELETLDRELLNLLGTQAAMAIYCTELHSRGRATEGMSA